MSKADLETVNLQYETWCADRLFGLPKVKPFEFFCVDQFLKNRSLSTAEIISGQVDRPLDGGVDGFYCFFNADLLDDSSVVKSRTEGVLELKIFQCKENDGFSVNALDKFGAFIDDLLGGNEERDYLNEYHNKLLGLMRMFQEHFKELRKRPPAPTLDIEFFYITRKDTEPNQSAKNRAERLQEVSKNYYTKTIIRPVNFVNVERLWTQFKIAPPSKKIIPVVESFGTKEGYVGLAKLADYYKFLHQIDEDEAFNPVENKDPILDEQLFDSNVRGYQIKSGVNGRIARTLKKGTDEFWLLNNGITVICSDVIHSNEAFDIDDPQIVNGLQTSRRIFEYYKGLKDIPENDERRILIRAIKSHGETKRSDIIRATNDQNSMPAEAFLSTLRIQHQIEATFEKNGLFYDRRKGYYRDLRKPATEIVEVVFLTQAIVSILLRKPHDGRGRPKDYFKENKRHLIWGSDGSDQTNKKEPFDLDVYLRCVQILRKVDNYLAGLDITETKAKDLRCYIALDVAAHAVSNAYCPPHLIINLDVERDITKDLLESAYKRVYKIYKKRGEDDNAAKNKGMAEDLTKLLIKELSPKKKKRK